MRYPVYCISGVVLMQARISGEEQVARFSHTRKSDCEKTC